MWSTLLCAYRFQELGTTTSRRAAANSCKLRVEWLLANPTTRWHHMSQQHQPHHVHTMSSSKSFTATCQPVFPCRAKHQWRNNQRTRLVPKDLTTQRHCHYSLTRLRCGCQSKEYRHCLAPTE